jgi:ketosteroid isomerase-like protein
MTALLLVITIVAQNPDSSALIKLEDDWARALVRRDTAVFQRLLAPGFVYSENDQTTTRDEVLRGVATGPDTVEAAANQGMTVHRFGTTALVTGWLVVRGRGSSGAFERRYRYTDTWMKRGKQWQIVGAHDYLAPK